MYHIYLLMESGSSATPSTGHPWEPLQLDPANYTDTLGRVVVGPSTAHLHVAHRGRSLTLDMVHGEARASRGGGM